MGAKGTKLVPPRDANEFLAMFGLLHAFFSFLFFIGCSCYGLLVCGIVALLFFFSFFFLLHVWFML